MGFFNPVNCYTLYEDKQSILYESKNIMADLEKITNVFSRSVFSSIFDVFGVGRFNDWIISIL